MPSISVALATYNGEKYLHEQLESLAHQTLLPSELVVADDQSSDCTLDIVQAFASEAPFPVRISRSDVHLGYRANFMRAAELCRSDLIAFCDQDDIWDQAKIATMVPVFEDPEVLLAYHNAVVVDESGKAIGRLHRDSALFQKLPPLAVNPWSIINGFTQVFRRSLMRFASWHACSLDPYWPGQRLAHDQWLLFLASVFGCIVRLSAPLVRYRQHDLNAFGWWPGGTEAMPPGHYLRDQNFIAAARSRSEILQQIALSLAEERTRATAGVAYYETLQQRLADRLSLYLSPALTGRAKTFYALSSQRAYVHGSGPPPFGWKGMLLDACWGVLLGPWASRFLSRSGLALLRWPWSQAQ